tara:strand:- start:7269 stop:8069 length:801 start_codon:yes stop_codon:yes gene_type:complete
MPYKKTKEEQAAYFKTWYEKNKARVALKNQAKNEELKQSKWTCECGKTLKGTCNREGHYGTAIHKKLMLEKETGVVSTLTEEQKREKANEYHKEWYEKKLAEKGLTKRVPQTEEQKKERRKETVKKWYEKKLAEKGLTARVRVPQTEEQKKERVVKKVRVLLTEEEKKERAIKRAAEYYQKHKAERNAYNLNYKRKNKDKINENKRLNYVKKERTTRSDKGSLHTYPPNVVRPKRKSKYANETEEEKAARMSAVNHQKYLRRKQKQ